MATILVIEDDSLVRSTLAAVFEDCGYKIFTANDGRQGMAVFHAERPDLVITDIMMPVQGGLQTITEMRNEKHDAKIIAISGGGRTAETDFLIAARALGAVATLPKPFDPDVLLNLVGDCLAGREQSKGQET
jgi:two-component system, chemotaxis family, chemotaxis protein CheY